MRKATLLVTCLAVLALAATGQERKPMGDIPDSAGMWLYFRAYYDPVGDESEIEAPADAGYIKVGYDSVRNRIKIFEASGDKRQLPTFAAGFEDIFSAAIPVIDQDGNFGTTPVPSTAQPIIDLTGFPTGVRWPQNVGGYGQVMGTSGVLDELAPDGVTDVERYVQRWQTVPHKMNGDETFTLDLESTSAHLAVEGKAGYRIIVTQYVWHSASADISDAVVSAGFNSTAYDDNAEFDLTQINSVDDTLPQLPDPGGKRGGDGADLYVKLVTIETKAATIVLDVFGYYQRIPE